MIRFLLDIGDDGRLCVVKTLPDGGIDPTFEVAHMDLNDRIDLHVDLSRANVNVMFPSTQRGPRRMVSVSLFDDAVPDFSSQEEADLWLEARARR